MFAMTNLYISQSCMFQYVLSHDILTMLLPQSATERGAFIESNHIFLVAVAAGVACHYIIKWLDGDE